MKRASIYFALIVILLLISTFIGAARQDENFTIGIKIFRILAFQSKIVAGKAEGGLLMGTVIDGNVTASFPDGYIVLKTTQTNDNLELIQLIEQRISSYPCSCPDFTQVDSYSKHEIQIDPNKIKHDSFEFHNKIFRGGLISGEYWLYVTPVTANNHNAILEFELLVQDYNSLELCRAGCIEKIQLLCRQIEMEANQTLLVGFREPSGDERYKNSVYWFTFTKTHSTKDKIKSRKFNERR